MTGIDTIFLIVDNHRRKAGSGPSKQISCPFQSGTKRICLSLSFLTNEKRSGSNPEWLIVNRAKRKWASVLRPIATWRRTKEQHSNLEIPIFCQDIIPQRCNDNRFRQTKHNDGRGKPLCTISQIRHGVLPQHCNDNGFHQTKHKDGSGKPLCTISQIRHGVLLSIITVSSLKWRT